MTQNQNKNLLEIESDEFTANFNKKAFTVKHNLVTHPLLALPRLIELSQALPESSVEYNAGTVGINQDPNETPRTGLSPEETLRRIEEQSSWLVLKNVEKDPEYKALLDACLDEIQVYSEAVAPGMTKREAFIFVSSPGSTTPYHIDPEYNFLLQIRGTKFMSVFDRQDRTVLSEEQIENSLTGAHRNLSFKPEFQERGVTFELPPGVGLHVPVNAPHWVKNGDQVSISLSITFQNPANDRRRAVYQFNAGLRKRGINPTPFGKSPLRDSIKFNMYRIARRAKLVRN
jgi:hypothetical protein